MKEKVTAAFDEKEQERIVLKRLAEFMTSGTLRLP